MTKTDDGMEFPSEAYAYVGEPDKPDTWKVRTWETPEKKDTVAQLGRAAAALSPGGFRGEPVDLPAGERGKVVSKIRSAYTKLGVKNAAMPEHLQMDEGPGFVIDLAAIALEELTRIPIAVLGKFHKGTLKFSITKTDLAALVENFRKRATGETVIDYEHASEFPEVAAGGPIPAAGWLKKVDPEPDAKGILWGQAEFTDRARKLIEAKEYKYLSPVIHWGAREKTSGEQQGATLTSMALVNRPFLEALPAIQLSEAWVAETETAVVETVERREPMVKKVALADRAAGTVRVTAEDGSEHVHAVEGLEAPPKVVRLSDVKRDKDGRMDFASLPHDQLIAGEVVGAMESQRALDAAIQTGKILPAQRKHYETLALADLSGFQELVAGMKPQVDLSERGVAGTGAEANELGQVEARIDTEARKLVASDKIQYHEALKLVAREHPELDRRRTELIREKVS